jgi:hypothetical protein
MQPIAARTVLSIHSFFEAKASIKKERKTVMRGGPGEGVFKTG